MKTKQSGVWLASTVGALVLLHSQTVAAQTRPCEVGSVITAITSSAGVARMGSVYSTTLYDPSNETNNTTHNPKKIQVRVTKNGVAKANCSVAWAPNNGTASGWVFPDSAVSDANGYVSAWWVAGTATNQRVNVSIQQTDGVTKSASITGTAYGHATRANSIHVNWQSPAWDRFSVDVTPQTWPATTYYSTMGFNGGYTGIQSHQTLFSLWDVNGVSPVVIDQGISTCSSFGGEGTGIKCEAPITPKTGVTYRFELETSLVAGGKQDYTMYFTDLTNNTRKKLATMRVPTVLNQSGAAAFVEDWWTEANTCLNNAVRSAKFSNVRYRNQATQAWANIVTGTGSAVYTPNHNEICVNYKFDFSNGVFTATSGGLNVGYPLNMPGSAKNYPNAWVDTPTAQLLSSGVTVSNIALAVNGQRMYAINVPAGKTRLTITTSGGTGDADIYTKFASVPSIDSYLQASEGGTNAESITVNAPSAGTYYILLNAYAAFSGVSLVATVQ